MKIYLVDNINTGHHYIYQNALNNIENTFINNNIMDFCSIKVNFMKAFTDRKKFINNIKNKKEDIVHFLYLDSIYKCPFISKIFKKINGKCIATLHWIPKDIVSKYLLKDISNKLEYIIVHSEFLKNELNNMGIYNVIKIDYPSFLNLNVGVKSNENNEKIVLTCLGGTRYDKGMDILIDSFKYINYEIKNKIVFRICGKEEDIKFNDIKNEASKHNINISIENKFLSDEEYVNEVHQSDIILLPYKKIFSGNSGPMTDGIYLNKFIIGPNFGNLGYLIDKYKLGATFEVENSESLAKTISNIGNYKLDKHHDYAQNLSIESFIERHKKIYNELSKK